MSWITNFVKPKIKALIEKKDVPDNLWVKCPSCETMLFHKDLEGNQHVCSNCGHHMKIDVLKRLEHMFDGGKFTQVKIPSPVQDPLKFRDLKRYNDRMRDARQKTGREDAIIVASGKIGGHNAVVAAFDFSFMGGSMGMMVGEGLVTAAKQAVAKKAALITIPASGGARMQEGILSLMQMPRSIVGTEMVHDAGLPHIVILTDPTTGGVSASFAMLGDVHIAEPKAQIGFAGKRVIQETIKEQLPDDFQTAEYLLAHGMVDMVVPRNDIPKKLANLLGLFMQKQAA